MPDDGFDIQKKIQAASVLVKLEGGRIDRLRLLKLLYLADREVIAERSVPIIGGRTSALDHGPLHDDVYDSMKETINRDTWTQYFANDGHSIVLVDSPELFDLSEYEIDKLTSVFEQYKDIDTWSLVEVTHRLPEWKQFYRPGSSATIPLEAILAAVGYSAEQIDEITAEARAFSQLP